MDIDMRNMITLIRAKRKGPEVLGVSASLIKNGNIEPRRSQSMYSSSDSVAAFASR